MPLKLANLVEPNNSTVHNVQLFGSTHFKDEVYRQSPHSQTYNNIIIDSTDSRTFRMAIVMTVSNKCIRSMTT